MSQFLNLKTCLELSSLTEPKFGLSRLCFQHKENEKKEETSSSDAPKEGTDHKHVSGEEKEETKEKFDKRKDVVTALNRADLAAMRAKLGPLPKKPGEGDKEEDKEDDKEDKGDKPKEGKEKDKEKLKPPHLPERAKDALSGKQVMEEFKKCKTNEERQRLMMEQFKQGNFPDSFRNFKTMDIVRNGKKYKAKVAPSGVRFGTDNDFIELPFNGPLGQAFADAMGCSLPSEDMVDQIYEQAKKNPEFQSVPFVGQVQNLADSRRMRSPEFIQTHNDNLINWAKRKGFDFKKPMYGYYKNVIEPSDSQSSQNKLDIYGGFGELGNLIEPGGVRHDPSHDDYSQNIMPIILEDEDGKPVDTAKHRYQYPDWMKQEVAEIRKLTPGAPPLEFVAKDDKEKPTYHEVSAEKINKGTVTTEYDYQLGRSPVGGHAKFVKTEEGDVALVQFNGKEHQLKVDLDHVMTATPKGYGAADAGRTEIIRPFGYVMLKYFMDHKMPVGSTVPFVYEGKNYVAQYQIHPADAGVDHEHPGVGLMIQSNQSDDAGISDQPRREVVASNPKPSEKPSIPDVKPNIPAESPKPVVPAIASAPKRHSSGGGSLPAYSGAPSNGGYQAVSYNPAPAPAPQPLPAEAPVQLPANVPANPPAAPAVGPHVPVEGREGPPTVPYTTLGDSITVGVESQSRGSRVKLGYHERKGPGGINQEEVGKNTDYMKEHLQSEVLPSLEANHVKVIVMGGGANDFLGYPFPNDEAVDKVVKKTTDNLSEMYKKSHDAGLKVVGMTMPPFDLYIENHYKNSEEKERCYKVWNKVNEYIMSHEGQPDGPDKVVKAHEIVGQKNGDQWNILDQYAGKNDPQKIHPQPAAYGAIAAEVEKAVNALSEGDQKKNNIIA